MYRLYEKLYYVIGEILLHCDKVHAITKPKKIESNIVFFVQDRDGMGKSISIPIVNLMQYHDYSLDNYIINIIEENDL